MYLPNFMIWSLAQSAPASFSSIAPNRWTVDYGRVSCTLVRRVGDASSSIVGLNAPLGTEPGELVVLDGGTGLDARLRGELQIRLDQGVPITARVGRGRRNGLAVATLSPLPDDFQDRFAGADQLSVSSGGALLFSLRLPGARAAVEELSRCNEDLLRSWGIDVGARRSLQRLARLSSMDWASSIMPSANTYLVFVANVSERGRPVACRIVVSSRNPRMDTAFCNLVRSRARFIPALNAAGQPAPAEYVTRVRWIIDPEAG